VGGSDVLVFRSAGSGIEFPTITTFRNSSWIVFVRVTDPLGGRVLPGPGGEIPPTAVESLRIEPGAGEATLERAGINRKIMTRDRPADQNRTRR